jgi:hypothetical protein
MVDASQSVCGPLRGGREEEKQSGGGREEGWGKGGKK